VATFSRWAHREFHQTFDKGNRQITAAERAFYDDALVF
jgi:hypothetical protein